MEASRTTGHVGEGGTFTSSWFALGLWCKSRLRHGLVPHAAGPDVHDSPLECERDRKFAVEAGLVFEVGVGEDVDKVSQVSVTVENCAVLPVEKCAV